MMTEGGNGRLRVFFKEEEKAGDVNKAIETDYDGHALLQHNWVGQTGKQGL